MPSQSVENGVAGDGCFNPVGHVLRAERGGRCDDFSRWGGEATSFFRHRLCHSLGRVGVYQQLFHLRYRPVAIRSTSCFTVGMKPLE